jgi:hypothetical protein
MTYRPTFRPQIGDPTTVYDGRICTFSSGAMGLDYHTKGGIKVWGGQLAKKPGVDPRDGGNLQELAKAWAAYGQNLNIKTGEPFSALVNFLKAGHGAVVQGDYDQLSLATKCQDSFDGDHAVYINPEFSGTKVLMGDPLCKSWKWIELSELRRYMEKLGRRNNLANGGVFFAITKRLAPSPTYPYGSKPYIHYVVTTAELRARKAPTTTADIVKTYPKGTRIRTALIDTDGGSYRVGTSTRDDWYGIKRTDGSYIWIARGHTRLA